MQFWAMVLSLEDDLQRPKIVKAYVMLKLKSDGKAVSLEPKKATDFEKNKEYGRIAHVGGEKMMVRHVIFKLHCKYCDICPLHSTARRVNGSPLFPILTTF